MLVFRRIARSRRLPSAEGNGRQGGRKSSQDPETPSDKPIRKQFSAHLGRFGKSSTLLGSGGQRKREKKKKKKKRKRKRERGAIKLPGKKLGSRMRINIPGQT